MGNNFFFQKRLTKTSREAIKKNYNFLFMSHHWELKKRKKEKFRFMRKKEKTQVYGKKYCV